VFEPPPGVSANLLRTFSTVPATRMCKVILEKSVHIESHCQLDQTD
jgi:dynein heavy chain 1